MANDARLGHGPEALRIFVRPRFLSPLRKAAISPIHNVRNLLYTFCRPLFPGLGQEKAEPKGDVKANGVVVRVFGAVLPLPDSHIPQMHIFFSKSESANSSLHLT